MSRGSSGWYISKSAASMLFLLFAGSLIAVGLLVYYLAPRQYESSSIQSTTIKAITVQPINAKPAMNVRLPRHVLPRHYKLRLIPFIEVGNFTTHGEVDILVECFKETSEIVLHSIDIDIDHSSIKVTKEKTKEELGVKRVSEDSTLQFLKIYLRNETLKPGTNYTIHIQFISKLKDEIRGFYRSSYVENGFTKYLATTQMEPVDARRAFPCFDEPNMKAEFSISLVRKDNMIALSNMPLVSSVVVEGMPGFVEDSFGKSVPMSTYLVAMVVAEFESRSNPEKTFRLWSRSSAIQQTEYALDIGSRILKYYETYFAQPYPLPKQDMIAIPDFGAAMENWGLITYKETNLLHDPQISSEKDKERVAVVVAHELAHQWFGNLVTMDWWTDLWLNEGFATYVEYIGVDYVEPSFHMFEQFVVENVHLAMNLDGLQSSHPISVVVNDPDEISEIFDTISYSKGGSVIRMLAGFLGNETFLRGLHYYLNYKKYGNAVQDDLWNAFSRQAKIDRVNLPATVKEIMDTWTTKMGYPVVTVTRNYQNQSAIVMQERFLSGTRNTSRSENIGYRWWVPLTYTTDYLKINSRWIAQNDSSITITNIEANENQWCIFNIDEVGFYRVNYDPTNWQLIHQQLIKDHTKISVINRAQILDDSFNLARVGLLDYGIALNLVSYLEKETQHIPWHAALSAFEYIESMMTRSPGYGLLLKFFRRFISPFYELVSFDEQANDSHLKTYNRILAIKWACNIGNEDCIKKSLSAYARWMNHPNDTSIISPNLMSVIGCNAIREGGEKEWNFALERYSATNVATEKDALLSAMSCSSQSWILSRMLEWSLNSTSVVRKQDAANVFSLVASNPLGRYLAFDFLRNNWKQVKAYHTSLLSLSGIVDSVTKKLNTELELKELIRFRDENQNDFASATRAVQQSIERTAANVRWMAFHYQKVVEWIEKNTVAV